jgi:hypothetical protein
MPSLVWLVCGALVVTGVVAQQQIPRNSIWSYYDKGVLADSSWRALTFNDATWATGIGPLGYGLTLAKTIISFGPSSSKRYPSSYFRKQFVATVPTNATGNVTMWVMCDDGCGVFINGAWPACCLLPGRPRPTPPCRPGPDC